jgi:hypothetical protein
MQNRIEKPSIYNDCNSCSAMNFTYFAVLNYKWFAFLSTQNYCYQKIHQPFVNPSSKLKNREDSL